MITTGTSACVAASAAGIAKGCSCATLTNVSYVRRSVRSVSGLVAASMSTRMLYRPPLSKMGPLIVGRPSPNTYSAPGALTCSEPPYVVQRHRSASAQSSTGRTSTLSVPSSS